MTPTFDISQETIIKETEKAICVHVLGEYSGGGRRDGDTKGANIWIPKSQIKNGSIPMWLLEAKARDLHFRSITFSKSLVGLKLY